MRTSAPLHRLATWALSGSLAVACGGEQSGESEGTSAATDTTAGSSSGSTATDSTTGGSGETGSAPGPGHEACERYLACIAVASPASLPSAQQGFGEDGTCWQGSDAEAQQCIDACQAGLEELHMASPNEPACALCQGDEDCEGGATCMNGECRIGVCGNGVVDSDEVCDAPSYCDDDCKGPSECSPQNGAGCSEGDVCVFEFDSPSCMPDDVDLPSGGEQCDGTCREGFVCLFLCNNENNQPCCEPLCNAGLETGACQAGQSCTLIRGMNLDYFNPPFELAEYVGVCM